MGREIRRVPPNWEHPKCSKYGDGRLQPMYDRSYEEASATWLQGLSEHKPEEHDGADFWEWEGAPPDREYHRPWSDYEATWFQLWETVSEGTPVSPPFETIEELAEYLATNGDFWDQSRGHGAWGSERAKRFCESGWAPSYVVTGGKLYAGTEIIPDLPE